ncbi:response regulator transcription factor [Thiomicrorhabdus sp. ZW0627]|uniref:response regulator transcription factor n=1 Tax=Thiomicrorhabdus sp. ZW0627 TaxID=3039774 RepID=UPI002436E754|nr:response regulator transcription factor [Thiomicrorhabdus sp. ZW0627]MDG6773448.1 response regulator transcription factor [Thiomicrorhabdus sp. ZW0627]
MKLLLAEDEALLAKNLSQQLSQQGFVVDCALDGEEALYLIEEHPYDLIILDLGLPKLPGLSVLQTMRSNQNPTPVIILTARNAWQDRVEGLKSGADDYVGKPFHFEELLARIQNVLKRTTPEAALDHSIQINGLTLNLESQRVVTDDGVEHPLTHTEFRLLRFLMSHPNKLLSKSDIMAKIVDQNYDRDSNVLEVYIRRLRKLIGKQRIETQRGQGYRFVAEES